MGEAITKTLAHSLERLDAPAPPGREYGHDPAPAALFGRDAAVFFVDGMCSGEFLQRFVLDPARAVAEASTTPAPGSGGDSGAARGGRVLCHGL